MYFGSVPTSSINAKLLLFLWTRFHSTYVNSFCLQIRFLFWSNSRSVSHFALLLIRLAYRSTVLNTPDYFSGQKKILSVKRFKSMATIQIMWFQNYFPLFFFYYYYYHYYGLFLFSFYLSTLRFSRVFFFFVARFRGSTRKPYNEPTSTVCGFVFIGLDNHSIIPIVCNSIAFYFYWFPYHFPSHFPCLSINFMHWLEN